MKENKGPGWLAGCLACWLPGWLAAWLAGWPAGRFAGWLAGHLAGWLAAWLAACLAGCPTSDARARAMTALSCLITLVRSSYFDELT